jgi:hypothetical protein
VKRTLTIVRERTRRGTIYLLVLVTTAIVTAMGVAGVMIVRSERASLEWSLRTQRASRAAESGLHIGLQRIGSDMTWRSGIGAGVNGWWSLGSYRLDGADAVVTITDAVDANLTNDLRGDVLLRAVASSSSARRALQFRATPIPTAISCLSYAIGVKGASTLTSGTIQTTGGMSCNLLVTNVLATVNADVRSSTLLVGLGFNGSNSILAKPVDFPAKAMFSDYASIATPISYSSISGNLRRCVLGPGINPFGTASPTGVYVIDCNGSSITIEDVRISGTLILLNAGIGSRMRNQVLIQSTTPGMPAILCDGPMTIETTIKSLSESTSGANFNPAALPYRGGSDTDQTDNYPSRIDGLVYISGAATFSGDINIVGALYVGGALTSTANLLVTPDSRILAAVPPGFESDITYSMVDGTWESPAP